MKFLNPYWTVKDKIELLCRWILVHSIIYYQYDENVIEDMKFDNNCRQLIKLIRNNPEAFKHTRWYYVFKDFDGSTGFDLPSKLKPKDYKILNKIALNLIKLKNERGNVKC